MKMMLGNINLLVSGAEPECGTRWWDLVGCHDALFTLQ